MDRLNQIKHDISLVPTSSKNHAILIDLAWVVGVAERRQDLLDAMAEDFGRVRAERDALRAAEAARDA